MQAKVLAIENTAQLLVKRLQEHGVSTIFGLPGIQLDSLFDALYDHTESVQIVQTRHEQATSYMAYGYARSTGRPGVCLVVPGPGVLNAMAGLATAYACNTPVLCVAGQIPSYGIGRGFGLLHELPDQLQALKSVSKWAARLVEPEDVNAVVDTAFRELESGRTRPVALEIPPDVLTREPVLLRQAGFPDAGEELNRAKIDEAATLLANSKAPAMFVGSGAFGAEAEVRRLAEHLQCPVVMSVNGRGVVPDDNPLAQNELVGHALWAQSDVVLAVGTRLHMPLSSWGIDANLKLIRVDIDEDELYRFQPPTIGISADAKVALGYLLDTLQTLIDPQSHPKFDLSAMKADVAERLSLLEPQASYSSVLRAALPRDAIVVNEFTQMGYYMNYGFPVYEPRTYITSGYQGTLGFGFPTALGAKVANPTRTVLSINGDGGFMYNVQELATAVKYRIPVITIVFNNNAFGNVRTIQREAYNARFIASDLTNPDFVALAESFGVEAYRSETPQRLRETLDAVIDTDVPVLIEVPMGEVSNIWPQIPRSRVRGLGNSSDT